MKLSGEYIFRIREKTLSQMTQPKSFSLSNRKVSNAFGASTRRDFNVGMDDHLITYCPLVEKQSIWKSCPKFKRKQVWWEKSEVQGRYIRSLLEAYGKKNFTSPSSKTISTLTNETIHVIYTGTAKFTRIRWTLVNVGVTSQSGITRFTQAVKSTSPKLTRSSVFTRLCRAVI